MEDKIKSVIMAGNFSVAAREVSAIDPDTLDLMLFEIGYDEKNITAYAFICFLIQQNETVFYHRLASTLLEIAFCHLEGAYQTSLYHTKRAIELSPNDIDLKENLLFFNEIPEKVIDDEEAKKIAKEVLQKKPDSEPARKVLAGDN